MGAAFHPGGERAALEAVPPNSFATNPAATARACTMRPIERVISASSPITCRGGGIRSELRWLPDAPEHRARGDFRGLQASARGRGPGRVRCGHRAWGPARQRFGCLCCVAGSARSRDSVRCRSAQVKAASSERRSARPRRPRRSSEIGASKSRSTVRVAARFYVGLGASRRMPAMVSDTSAGSVGEGRAAARSKTGSPRRVI